MKVSPGCEGRASFGWLNDGRESTGRPIVQHVNRSTLFKFR